MTLQNRVDPWGRIVATPERGTMMGNRGGRFHRDDQTLGRRRWATHHWICCEIHYKDLHHESMGKGYTSLFFLDEVTALAAGHRPCFFCRRPEAKEFMSLCSEPLKLDEFDRRLHAERLASSRGDAGGHDAEWDKLPDGTMVAKDGVAFAVRGPNLLSWSFGGYRDLHPRKAAMPSMILTPPHILAILARGYRPRWHESADKLMGGRI